MDVLNNELYKDLDEMIEKIGIEVRFEEGETEK